MLGLRLVPGGHLFQFLGQDFSWPAYQCFGSKEWLGQPTDFGAADL